MAEFNIFENDAFSTMSMLASYEKVPFQPSFLGDLKLFAPKPVIGDTVWIEERSGSLSLIQTTPRGAPPPQRTTERRTMRGFKGVRLAQSDRLMASEIAKVRAFGTTSELQAMQDEVARRLTGPLGLQNNINLTLEYHRLGAIQGIVLDADKSILFDWFSEFGIPQPENIYFDLAGANKASSDVNGATVLEAFIRKNVIRPMVRAAKGAFTPQTQIYGICGDTFYDLFKSHGDVARPYGNWMNTNPAAASNPFAAFPWGGVNWVNYRGTDDNSTVAVADDEVKFFPVNAPGVFVWGQCSGEAFDEVAVPGQEFMPKIIRDKDRNAYVDLEAYSYPLMYCSRPEVLLRGKSGASA